jgi:hypothetical protein
MDPLENTDYPQIITNQVRCHLCDDTPFSAHRHDFKYCKCGNVAVDGGTDYLRRLGKDLTQYTDLSFSLPISVVEAAIKAVEWGQETGRNPRGIAYAVFRALYDNGRLKTLEQE